jgi:hypothetical protein
MFSSCCRRSSSLFAIAGASALKRCSECVFVDFILFSVCSQIFVHGMFRQNFFRTLQQQQQQLNLNVLK